jgi:hypothetical protein
MHSHRHARAYAQDAWARTHTHAHTFADTHARTHADYTLAHRRTNVN